MVCRNPSPVYTPHSQRGLKSVISKGDGYSVGIEWTQAYPDIVDYQIAYNIYYSSNLGDVFTEGVKFVEIDPEITIATISELTPGDTYYFAVCATEYDESWFNLDLLPDGQPDLKVYPSTILLSNISDTTTTIPIVDINDFPAVGIIQIGFEIIQYASKDIPSSSLLGASRGFLNTNARIHYTDGYDGVVTHDPPLVKFWEGFEDFNPVIMQETCSFEYPNYPYTLADGYHERVKDDLTTDLGGSDANQVSFPTYDFGGYHTNSPTDVILGNCVGSYIGGEQFCADGYGVGQRVRGISINDINTQRQEILLDTTGEPCVLVRRRWTGKTCNCFESTSENPSLRCPNCYGVGIVTGYDQYFNPRRSDGRIMISFDPTMDDLKLEDTGLESTFLPNAWTLVVPTIKDRDFIIRFTEDGQEEFRYKVLNVTRNKLVTSVNGAQKLALQRIRKTDPIYQWRAFRDTSSLPQTISTSVGFIRGPNNTTIPHTHNIVISEKILSVSQINETTSVSLGHNHSIINGVVVDSFSHSHTIILP